MSKPIIAALLVLLVFSAAWAFADFLKSNHAKRMQERHEQLSKDLSVKRPTTDAWRRHAGVD